MGHDSSILRITVGLAVNRRVQSTLGIGSGLELEVGLGHGLGLHRLLDRTAGTVSMRVSIRVRVRTRVRARFRLRASYHYCTHKNGQGSPAPSPNPELHTNHQSNHPIGKLTVVMRAKKGGCIRSNPDPN